MRLLTFIMLLPFYLSAQFPPPAGQAGSSAIHVDSANWQGWATNCQLERGFQNISNPALGPTTSGSANSALGPAADGAVLSLGDGGSAILNFSYPIKNGTGADFAVFENAFSDSFLELAFVEVSSDGIHFVRFPATSNTDTSTQVNTFGSVDATQIHNLAGKYRYGYGTPFDLEDLKDSANIDLNAITHIRILDAIGSIDSAYAQRDHLGQIINDPFPTPFAEGGFDLDAVGVLHFNYQANLESNNSFAAKVYPNPTNQWLNIELPSENKRVELSILDLSGQLMIKTNIEEQLRIDLSNWPKGLYLLKIGTETKKIILH